MLQRLPVSPGRGEVGGDEALPKLLEESRIGAVLEVEVVLLVDHLLGNAEIGQRRGHLLDHGPVAREVEVLPSEGFEKRRDRLGQTSPEASPCFWRLGEGEPVGDVRVAAHHLLQILGQADVLGEAEAPEEPDGAVEATWQGVA